MACRFFWRPVGLDDAFGLGHAALQANHQRQILPNARIGILVAIGAAQGLLGLGQVLGQHIGKAEIGQHRRVVGGDFQRARIVLPRFIMPAELIEGRALGRKDMPIRIVRGYGRG